MYKFNIFFTTKTVKENGCKFKSYFTTSTNDGKPMSVKFTKEVVQPEKAVCLHVSAANARISSKKGYDTLIISGYEKADSIEDSRMQKYFTEVDNESN